jgi:hypothetical protein
MEQLQVHVCITMAQATGYDSVSFIWANIKYVQPLESNCWPGVILKVYYIHAHYIAIVLYPNYALFGVVTGVWWYHLDPPPR